MKMYRDKISPVDVRDRLTEGGIDSSTASELAKVLATKDDLEDVKDTIMATVKENKDTIMATVKENKDTIMAAVKENRDAINRLADKIEGKREGKVNRRSNALWGIIGTAVGAIVAWTLSRL